ncbi:hypothetical protein ACIPSE_31800 [Streptomyces sp. NPDC090106]|uniref:hypothetical protein n=1 Tax=Streptomyces sp. NPDC090106 TaxID=3365946 RepID=UPI0037FE5FA0
MQSANGIADAVYDYRYGSGRRLTADKLFAPKLDLPPNSLWNTFDHLDRLLRERWLVPFFRPKPGDVAAGAASRSNARVSKMVDEYRAHQEFARAYEEFIGAHNACWQQVHTAGEKRDEALREGRGHPGGARGRKRLLHAEQLGSAGNRLESFLHEAQRQRAQVDELISLRLSSGRRPLEVADLTARLREQTFTLGWASSDTRRSIAAVQRNVETRRAQEQASRRTPAPPPAAHDHHATATVAALRRSGARRPLPEPPRSTPVAGPSTPQWPAHGTSRSTGPTR